jgi:hypothetical protein
MLRFERAELYILLAGQPLLACVLAAKLVNFLTAINNGPISLLLARPGPIAFRLEFPGTALARIAQLARATASSMGGVGEGLVK